MTAVDHREPLIAIGRPSDHAPDDAWDDDRDPEPDEDAWDEDDPDEDWEDEDDEDWEDEDETDEQEDEGDDEDDDWEDDDWEDEPLLDSRFLRVMDEEDDEVRSRPPREVRGAPGGSRTGRTRRRSRSGPRTGVDHHADDTD